MGYIYAVADIHARYDLLEELLDENVNLMDKNNKLICCGDYIDNEQSKGNSYKTLQYLYSLQHVDY